MHVHIGTCRNSYIPSGSVLTHIRLRPLRVSIRYSQVVHVQVALTNFVVSSSLLLCHHSVVPIPSCRSQGPASLRPAVPHRTSRCRLPSLQFPLTDVPTAATAFPNAKCTSSRFRWLPAFLRVWFIFHCFLRRASCLLEILLIQYPSRLFNIPCWPFVFVLVRAMFHHLFCFPSFLLTFFCLGQGFSNRALVPPCEPRSCFLGATSRRLPQTALLWYCITQNKLDIFIDEQGPQVLRVFWRQPRLMKVWEPLV